jgi:hypothetical protein
MATLIRPQKKFGSNPAAEWHQKKQEWMTDHMRIAIRDELGAELIVSEWQELEQRARGCDPSETHLSANVYFEDDGGGFFFVFNLWHTDTCVWLKEHRSELFETQGQAFLALAAYIARHVAEQGGKVV